MLLIVDYVEIIINIFSNILVCSVVDNICIRMLHLFTHIYKYVMFIHMHACIEDAIRCYAVAWIYNLQHLFIHRCI